MSKKTGIRISQKLAKELLGNYLKIKAGVIDFVPLITYPGLYQYLARRSL